MAARLNCWSMALMCRTETAQCLCPGIRRRTYKNREAARQDMFDYVEMFYNPVRKQVRNGMLSLVEFERQQI